MFIAPLRALQRVLLVTNYNEKHLERTAAKAYGGLTGFLSIHPSFASPARWFTDQRGYLLILDSKTLI